MIFLLFFVAVIQASIKYAPLPPRTSNTPLQNDSDDELRQYRQPSPTSFANRLSSKLQNILTPPPRPELFPAEMMDLHFGKGKLYPSYCFEGNPTLFPIYYVNSHYTIMIPSPDLTTWVPSAFNPFYPSYGDIHRQRQRQNHQISSNQATITVYEVVPEKPGFYRQPLNLMCTKLVKSAPINEKDYHQNVHLRLSEQQLQALASHAPPQQQEMIYNQSSVIQGAFYVDARYKPATVSPYLEFEALQKVKAENETESTTILTFQLLSSNHEGMSPGFKRILRGSQTLICCSCETFKTFLKTDEHHQILKNLNFEDHLTRQSFVALLRNSAYFRSLWTFHFDIPKEMVLPLCNSFATHPLLHSLIFPPELLARSKRLLKNFKKILLKNHISYEPSEGFVVVNGADDIAAIATTNNIELPASLPMLKDFLLSPTFFSDYHSHQRRQIYQRLPDIIYGLSGIRYHKKLPFQTVLERILKEDFWGIEVSSFLFWGSPSPMISSIMPMMGVINSVDTSADGDGDFEAPLLMMSGSPPTVGQYQLDGPITHKRHLKAGLIGHLWKEISFPTVESWIPYLARHLKKPCTGLLRPATTTGSFYELQKDGSLYVIASDTSDYYKNILLVILYPFLCAGDDKHLIRFSREYWTRLRDISLSLKDLSQPSRFALNTSEHEIMLVREFDKISFFERCPVEAMFEEDVSDDSIWNSDAAVNVGFNSVDSDSVLTTTTTITTTIENEVTIDETDFVVEEFSKEIVLDCVVDCLLSSDHLLDAIVVEDIAQQQQKEDSLIDAVLDVVLDAVFIEQLELKLEDVNGEQQLEQEQQQEEQQEQNQEEEEESLIATKTEAQRAAAARKRAKQRGKKKEKKMRDTLENPEFGALCQQLGLYVENFSIADRVITFRPCSTPAASSSSAKVSTTSKGALSCDSAFTPSASSAFTPPSEDSPPSITQFPGLSRAANVQQQPSTVDANGAKLLSQPSLLPQQGPPQLKQDIPEQQLKQQLPETFRTISQSLEKAGFVILDMMGEQILTDSRGRKHFYGSVLPDIPLQIQHEKTEAAISVCITIEGIKQSQAAIMRNSVRNLCPSDCPHYDDGNASFAGKRYYDFSPADIPKSPMAVSYDEEDVLVFFMMFGRLTAKELKKNLFVDLMALFSRHPKMFSRELVKAVAGKWKSVPLTLRRISGVFLSDSQYRQIQSFLMERSGFDQEDLKNHARGLPLSIPLKDSLPLTIYRKSFGSRSGLNGRSGLCAYSDDTRIERLQSTKIPSVVLKDEVIEYWAWVQVYSSFMYLSFCEGARMHVEKYLALISFERVWIAQTGKSIVEQCIRAHQSYSSEYKQFLLAFNELILNARMMEILRCIPSCKISCLNAKFPQFANCLSSLKICSMMARSPLNIFDDAHVLILLKFLEYGEALQSNPIFNRRHVDVDYDDVNASLAALSFCDSNA